jgi:hypothetical protein
MNTEELTQKYQDKHFADCNLFTLEDIHAINFNPHPFTIGAKHVAHAAEHHGGILGIETMSAIGCAVPNCNLSHEEHKYDTVMFLKLKFNVNHSEAVKFLKSLEEDLKADKIDGFILVETPEKFRFVDDTTTPSESASDAPVPGQGE